MEITSNDDATNTLYILYSKGIIYYTIYFAIVKVVLIPCFYIVMQLQMVFVSHRGLCRI